MIRKRFVKMTVISGFYCKSGNFHVHQERLPPMHTSCIHGNHASCSVAAATVLSQTKSFMGLWLKESFV